MILSIRSSSRIRSSSSRPAFVATSRTSISRRSPCMVSSRMLPSLLNISLASAVALARCSLLPLRSVIVTILSIVVQPRYQGFGLHETRIHLLWLSEPQLSNAKSTTRLSKMGFSAAQVRTGSPCKDTIQGRLEPLSCQKCGYTAPFEASCQYEVPPAL
jgi:hypothetical protein